MAFSLTHIIRLYNDRSEIAKIYSSMLDKDITGDLLYIFTPTFNQKISPENVEMNFVENSMFILPIHIPFSQSVLPLVPAFIQEVAILDKYSTLFSYIVETSRTFSKLDSTDRRSLRIIVQADYRNFTLYNCLSDLIKSDRVTVQYLTINL